MTEGIAIRYDPAERTPPRRVVGLVHARMRSERLFGKCMLPLAGHPVALHAYWRLLSVWPGLEVWFMPTDDPADREILDLAKSLGQPYIVRPDAGWNLVAAYRQLHEAAQADLYITVDGDGPLTYTGTLARLRPHLEAGIRNYSLRTDRWHTRHVWNCTGAVGITWPWQFDLYDRFCDTDYLKGCPGPSMHVHAAEALPLVPPPDVYVDALPEEWQLVEHQRPHLFLEEYADAYVIGELYDALWGGPGPEGVIDSLEALRWCAEHPEVTRYNAHFVESVTNQTAAEVIAQSAPHLELQALLWEALGDRANDVDYCDACRAYLGYVRDGRYHVWSGAVLEGRGTVQCRICGTVKEWGDG